MKASAVGRAFVTLAILRNDKDCVRWENQEFLI